MVIVFLAINRAIAAIAILLIVPGIVGLVHPSFTYHQTEEIAKIASLDATVNEEKTAAVPAALSVVFLVAGIVLVVLGTRRSSNPGAGGKFFGGQALFPDPRQTRRAVHGLVYRDSK